MRTVLFAFFLCLVAPHALANEPQSDDPEQADAPVPSEGPATGQGTANDPITPFAEADPEDPNDPEVIEDSLPPVRSPKGGRLTPPGTPRKFVGRKPAPPYGMWPEDAPSAFETRQACIEWFNARAHGLQRAVILRFDAVHRRCVRTVSGWEYREDHAYAVLDPVLEPLLIIPPVAAALAQRTGQGGLVSRGLSRWDLQCGGDDCTLRYDTPPAFDVPNEGWRRFSDVMLYTSIAAHFLPLASSRGSARLTDTVIMTEVFVVNFGITEALKWDAAEPRPYAFTDLRAWPDHEIWALFGEVRQEEAWKSWISGHTSVVAASSFGLATLSAMHVRFRRLVPVLVPYVAAFLATALTATARVLAMRHDVTDVLIGGGVGIAVGVLVPLAHGAIAQVINPNKVFERQERKAGRVVITPTLSPQSVGVVGVW